MLNESIKINNTTLPEMFQIPKKLEWVNDTFNTGQQLGIFKARVTNDHLNGRTVIVNGKKEVIFFGNCSYLGLEINPEIQQAAIEAIQQYGTFFSSSRSFIGLDLNEQMEDIFERIFEKPVNVCPTTTLGHISNLPILVDRKDAVIMDVYVHQCVQTAVALCKAEGTHVEFLRHSQLDLLEEKINQLKSKHQRIWYMIDGVYSMFGDGAPMRDLEYLMNKYEQLYVYADDAHGMSWAGPRGSGYIMSQIRYHEKLFMGLSLSKGAGVGGAVMVYPERSIKETIKNCGSTMVFSGPMHPSTVVSAIKSAEIHLRTGFSDRQLDLKIRIEYFLKRARQLNIPVIGEHLTPIFFIGVGSIENGILFTTALIDAGFFVDIASFPSVPLKNTGLRITLTTHVSLGDIDKLLDFLSDFILRMESEGKFDREEVRKAFVPKQPRTINEKV